MPYTVKQLAKLSGVSVRTLHYYDELGLLSPAYTGDNQYRYYEEEQVLLLQQILFYRELGFQLNDIKKILCDNQFDKVNALQSHKNLLKGDLDRIKKLIKTIDKTIIYLRGKNMIKLEEIFDGFNEEKQKHYEDFLVKKGVSRDVLQQSMAKAKSWSKEQLLANKRAYDQIHASLVGAIKDNLSPESEEVQITIRQHYELTKLFWTPTKESYIGLSRLYGSNDDFVKFYHNLHPKLLDFMAQAMAIFAENHLA